MLIRKSSIFSGQPTTKLPLNSLLKQALSGMNIHELTKIQSKIIPYMLKNPEHHIKMVASTGSGKTLAFLLPIAEALLSKTDLQQRAVILTHSKELSYQTYRWARQLGINDVLRLGSLHYYQDKMALQKGADMVNMAIRGSLKDRAHDLSIVTPAQLSDVLLDRMLKHPPMTIVMDEADLLTADTQLKMLCQTICQKILDKSPKTRVVLSAACSPQEFLSLPFVSFSQLCKPAGLKEYFIKVREGQQGQHGQMLLALVQQKYMQQHKRTIVFFNSEQSLTQAQQRLQKLNPAVYYAGLSALDRLKAIQQQPLLLATNVGSRGLDLLYDVVIQFQAAANLATYTHRVGRTARAGRQGESYMFYSSRDQFLIDQLKRIS